MTFDPKTLNAEERALWDALAARYHERGGLACNAYNQTRGAWMDLLKARRAMFGEPAPKAEPEESMADRIANFQRDMDEDMFGGYGGVSDE